MNKLTLNTGITIPVIGTGTNTFGKENKDFMGIINNDTTELESALKIGYTLIDTAIAYRNESVVALGIKRSGISRNELFITSKIPGKPEYTNTDDLVEKAIQSSLKELDTDYIDLYLIHQPWADHDGINRVWKVLERNVEKGVLKAIGVSNFNVEQLERLLQNCTIKPAVNQIESHPGLWNDDIVDFCRINNINVEAWSPLKRIPEASLVTLKEIGMKYGKSWAQVVLRYQIERNVIVIPKSHNEERQKENFDIFDFNLSDEDRVLIKTL